MASIRRGYSDDFTLKNNSVGIGTSTGQEALDVVDGAVKGQDLKVTGISSFTAYEGFLRADQQIAENTTLSFDQGPSASLSGEIIVGTGQTVTVNEIVKETTGVGNGSSNIWYNLVDKNGSANPYSTNPKWDGNAFVFNADGDFRVDNFSETFGTSITVEWWGSSDYTSTNYKVPVMRTTNTSWNDGFGFYQFSGKVYWWVNAWDGAHRTEIAATSFGMTHWVGTYDGSNLKLYRNGSLVDTGSSFTADVTDPSVSLDIGGAVGHSAYRWDGSISIVRLYSTALTAAEINAQYKLGPKSKNVVVEPDVVHFNANNPLSYPGIVSDVDTTNFTRAGGSEIECLKVYNTFTPPSGGTNERPYAPKPGELYYNYDFKTIEFFDGYGWRQVDNTTRSGRAVFAGGYTPTSGAAGDFASVMDYVNISTKGNAVNFGEMHAGTYAAPFGFSSSTRGLFGGGYKNSTGTASNNDTAYITIASEGNTIDFGNLNSTKNWGKAAHASSTRGLALGGYGTTDDIDYVEIATLGNFLDFGDLVATEFGGAGMGSPTIALSVGSGPNGYINQVTIASKGNAILWGETDLHPVQQYYSEGGSNSVRGLFNKTREITTQVQSLIIASSGTVEDFGNLTSTIAQDYPGGNGNCASQTTLLFAGGGDTANAVNTIETISITTSGNATDFGDLTTKRGYMGACSDCHGGLGGF